MILHPPHLLPDTLMPIPSLEGLGPEIVEQTAIPLEECRIVG